MGSSLFSLYGCEGIKNLAEVLQRGLMSLSVGGKRGLNLGRGAGMSSSVKRRSPERTDVSRGGRARAGSPQGPAGRCFRFSSFSFFSFILSSL